MVTGSGNWLDCIFIYVYIYVAIVAIALSFACLHLARVQGSALDDLVCRSAFADGRRGRNLTKHHNLIEDA